MLMLNALSQLVSDRICITKPHNIDCHTVAIANDPPSQFSGLSYFRVVLFNKGKSYSTKGLCLKIFYFKGWKELFKCFNVFKFILYSVFHATLKFYCIIIVWGKYYSVVILCKTEVMPHSGCFRFWVGYFLLCSVFIKLYFLKTRKRLQISSCLIITTASAITTHFSLCYIKRKFCSERAKRGISVCIHYFVYEYFIYYFATILNMHQ